MKTIVPIFFSVNDAYSPFLATAIHSIRENASPDFRYHIHILTDDISEENRRKLSALGTDSFCIEFHPLSRLLRSLPAVEKLSQHCFGAFSSLTIYFRLFIPELFPQYDKGIYLDADLVVPGDISWLYREPISGGRWCYHLQALGGECIARTTRSGPYQQHRIQEKACHPPDGDNGTYPCGRVPIIQGRSFRP